MYRLTISDGFEQWREVARRLAASGIEPAEVDFVEPGETPHLLGTRIGTADLPGAVETEKALRVPKRFIEAAPRVACHRSGEQWALMYRLLYRFNHGEPRLMRDELDEDVLRFSQLDQHVRRDRHKMHAFVRFRRVEPPDLPSRQDAIPSEPRRVDADKDEYFVAFHRPDHRILRLAVPHFVERFRAMHWSILTPDASAHWDTHELTYSEGVPQRLAPESDDLEHLWKTYYGSIFNPARIKTRAMKAEMPTRHWNTLPEAETIPRLLAEAPARVETMIARSAAMAKLETSARDFLPDVTDAKLSIPLLREAAAGCRGCDLCEPATQTVFGEGPEDAKVVFVGEQPGDQEDRVGRPFVGPAGQMLDELLEQAGVDRSQIYVTNTVKHFKFQQRGKRRMHAKPNQREINSCIPWLEKELQVVRPAALVCLGATAAQALMGRTFRITKQRGEVQPTDWCDWTLGTWHPSALLRMPEERGRDQAIEDFTADMVKVRERMETLHP